MSDTATTPTTSSSSTSTSDKKAWATLITNNAYLPGLLVLNYSLKRAGSTYPFVALYADAFPAASDVALHSALRVRGIQTRRVTELRPSIDRAYGADVRFTDTWSKLAVFECTEYERLVLLDSDMLVLRNMDELMDRDLGEEGVFAASHACVCNPLKLPHYPEDWVPVNCAFFPQHRDPDRAQVEGGRPEDSFGMPNSGLVVAKPSMDVLQKIKDHLQKDAVEKYSFPDQEVLGVLFSDRWVTLPYVYNALKPMRQKGVHNVIWRDEEVKNVHYILSSKPWTERPEDADEVNGWWHRANAERLMEERDEGLDDGSGGV